MTGAVVSDDMNYRPIGLSHGESCDSGEYEHMCDECRAEASRDWTIPEGDES